MYNGRRPLGSWSLHEVGLVYTLSVFLPFKFDVRHHGYMSRRSRALKAPRNQAVLRWSYMVLQLVVLSAIYALEVALVPLPTFMSEILSCTTVSQSRPNEGKMMRSGFVCQSTR